ncbi:GGDEF domain-containing protein [Rummeliibacillus sp. JY-2-4R]
MILDLIINFSLLFTFTVFFYFVYEYLQQILDSYLDLHPWYVGVASAITGLLLMVTAIHFNNHVIQDIRNVIIIIAGLIGGPISIAVSSVLIGLFRIYIAGISYSSVFAGLNTMIMGLFLSLFAIWKPISLRNMHYYLVYTILQISIALALLSKDSEDLIFIITLIINSVPALYATVFVLNLMRKRFDRIHAIEKLAETDYLTNLPNIKKFKSIIDEYLQNNEDFSILLIDIYHFREINTTYGHIVGDEVLKQIGKCLNQFVLEHDGMDTARISGEEFYVVCKHTAPAFALHYAHAISKQIHQNPIILSKGRKIQIAVSIGIANYPDNGEDIPSLIIATNQALDQAAMQGKNQIVHVNNVHTSS